MNPTFAVGLRSEDPFDDGGRGNARVRRNLTRWGFPLWGFGLALPPVPAGHRHHRRYRNRTRRTR